MSHDCPVPVDKHNSVKMLTLNIILLGDNRTLFVKPLPTDVTAEAIKKFFDTRHIVEVRVPDKLVYRGPRR